METYRIFGYIVGILCGIGIWIYALFTWGLLLGLIFGWIPGLIGGIICGLIWPVVVIAAVIVVHMIQQ